MSLLDKIPGELNLYIGGIFSLRRKQALQECNITHVLSVLRMSLDDELFEKFERKVVEVDDVEDENLLEHFDDSNRFIQEGLDAGGGVLVHCAMGKSRSAAVICAYLMHRYGIDVQQALAQVREGRPFCEPNEGFMKQLEIYHQNGASENFKESPAYQRWLYMREVDLSTAAGQAPEVEHIRFEDEHKTTTATSNDYELRCRKCRRSLATSQYLIAHSPRSSTPDTASDLCAHYFIDPLSWMRPELEQGKLEGRFECPKCKTNVGKYAWQGMRCSCGDWVVPGISLTKARIDRVDSKVADKKAMGIRMPPTPLTKKAGTGQGNL